MAQRLAGDPDMTQPSLGRRVVAEIVATALLLATVVGSGVMAERLAGGNVALALLANTLATAGALIALILAFGPISGAHMNPAVTLADAAMGGMARRDVLPYVVAQISGAYLGVAVAHGMFELPVFSASHHVRAGPAQFLSEFVASFGLLATIWGVARRRPDAVPFAVAAYIVAAYWFTASTSFANPAVTLARAASDTFAGIRPADAPAFMVAQVLGAAAATLLFRWLVPALPQAAPDILVPHPGAASTVIFACVHNAGRSQMAAAFFNAMADASRARAVSAGTQPGERVHPEVIAAMREVGIDLSNAQPQRLTPELANKGNLLVTMGCGEACPAVPGLRRDDWPLTDPKGRPIEEVRRIRDEIRDRVAALVAAEKWKRSA